MPRSIKRPQTGSVVWYYTSAPPATGPFAAIITKTLTRTQFNLAWFDAVGAPATALAVNYYDGGSRPASGAWCTHMRVQEPVTGAWPKDGGSEGPLGPAGVVVT